MMMRWWSGYYHVQINDTAVFRITQRALFGAQCQ